jgi:Mus7/MMS22 family
MLDPQMEVNHSLGNDLGDNMTNSWLIQSPEAGSNLPLQRDKDSRTSPISVDSSEDERTPNSRKGRLKRHTLYEHGSDGQIVEDDAEAPDGTNSDQASTESESSEDVRLTGKARKQLKALRRMMPAALRNKLLANQEDKTKPRAKERTNHQESEASDAPLQPGRGRKRIVSPSSRDPKRFEIRGHTESESECSDNTRTSDREVIVVDDDGGEEDAERALEESEDGLNDEDFQAWLAPEPQQIDASHETLRIRRPEIERDKPRGGDLIDRMLQRTRRVLPRLPRNGSGRKLGTKRPRNPTIEVITKDAKRLGAGGGRQTKLAVSKADGRGRSSIGIRQEQSPEGVTPSKQADQQHRVEAQDERHDGKNKKKKSKRPQVQSNLFIVHRNSHRITSGRPRQIIHIDDDDDAFHEALAPVGSTFQPCAPRQPKAQQTTRPQNIDDKFRHDTGTELDAFDVEVNDAGQRHSKISLDFDMVSLSSGLTLGPGSYIGKGRLYDLISVLTSDNEVTQPSTVTLLELQIDPNMPITQISSTFASACDKLYDASILAVDDEEVPMSVRAADALMHALCHVVTFRALRINDDDEGLLVTIISEQINHLLSRINGRVELVSADGHSMDYRTFALYWFAVEMHLRLVYTYQKRGSMSDRATPTITTHTAEQYCVQLLCRLLEYGFDRTIGLLQNGQLNNTISSNLRALEFWICIFHVAPYFKNHPVNIKTKPVPPFWRLVEAGMDGQANRPDSQLYESERIWQTIFSLCAVSQFSLEGLSTSTPRLEAHWPIVRKALRCIRLSADVRDNSKPTSTLHKRDTYLRLVTARCFLLCTRWNWRLNEADDMFQELCAIFRSRQFSNLLGEPDDFPTFIREGNEAFLDVHQPNDTAFGLFLKLIVRASKDFLQMDGVGRLRGAKLARLLSLAVPVGSTSFTKNTPPTGQGLSMLYNRYSAIFVSISVDSSSKHIRSRLQQVRRYIAFRDADYDSRTAAIRSMMHIAILLRHLNKPLDDILLWASEMIDDLIEDTVSSQVRSGGPAQREKDQLVVLVQLLLGSIRIITNTPTLSRSSDLPAKYPDIGLLQGAVFS